MDFEVKGIAYTCSKIDAIQQFHIVRRLAPVLSGLAPLIAMGLKGGVKPGEPKDSDTIKKAIMDDPEALKVGLSAITEGLARMSKADAEEVLHGLLSSVSRKASHGLGFAPVSVEGALMFADLTMPDMLILVWKALVFNCSDFLGGFPSLLNAEPLKASGL